ncbi:MULTISPECIES: CpaF family protein [Streptomyces]|uniref:CpaF family protein n=1 Tax=Streptomyces TaxID=1883 RepID=UPI0011F0FEE2|nr:MULTISPECIES: ATPase, T2SS/T4P/T4SS family [Streptomyces]
MHALPGGLPVQWEEIEALQRAVSDDLIEEETREGRLPEDARRELARSLVTQRVAAWASAYARTHRSLSEAEEEAVRQAVFDAMFHAGPLERYLQDPDVENIFVYGSHVEVEYYNRPAQRVPPVAADDAGLRRLINGLAARSGHGERQLTDATPMTHFRLPDGSRVAATVLGERDFLAIRRHRVLHFELEDLVESGTLSKCLSVFLHAAVISQATLLVTGPAAVGKTTLLRALLRKVPSHERVVTLETDRELYLSTPDGSSAAPPVVALEEREGNADGVGQVAVADMIPFTLRMSQSRVVVGEVRGAEAVPMLNAMAAGGRGSMCTLHADYPRLVMPRLTQLCRPAGMDREAVHEMAGNALTYVVFLAQSNATAMGGRKHRYVSHVLEVSPGEDGRVALDEIFAPQPGSGDPRAVPQRVPSADRMAELEAVGFQREWLTVPGYGRWGTRWDPAAGAPVESRTGTGAGSER